MEKKYCIYKIINLITGSFYIGAHITKNLNDDYLGSGTILNHSIKKYGRENFKKDILMLCESRNDMYNIEKLLVNKKLIDLDLCMNLVVGGIGGSISRPLSEEHKRKISIANKGQIASKESKQKMSMAHKGLQSPRKGQFVSEEAKQKMSIAKIGTTRTEKTKQKISATLKGRSTWNKGIPLSEEHKRKIREGLLKHVAKSQR